ncbi:hypothetical protein [Natronolimnohabitans innermongolicus]|uniref:Uncharacterized protein n=1 Tax=Natronolimnohabitans innermongolicus JCM 12255 TaxID=1227499 RepID=L9WRE5_9EURY|nr:hypothetical protein [Natronolimnohabitans innermongolicus]ELY52025.1 hypothetical protein C493_16731 [Natronolimnohabitans innermongolicus JCM 12255]
MSRPEGSSGPNERPWTDVSRFPTFVDHLEDEGAFSVREIIDNIDEEIPIDGVVYHDRGIRAPGYDATFVHEPNRKRPAFSLEVDTVGPRNTWAVFDAQLGWDLYLLQTDDVAALAWVSDEEYKTEEATMFDSKHEALAAGRFSFGVFLYSGSDWEERVDRIQRTNAPAYLKRDDGTPVLPQTPSEFYEYIGSSATELRQSGGGAPPYLGILELEVSID